MSVRRRRVSSVLLSAGVIAAVAAPALAATPHAAVKPKGMTISSVTTPLGRVVSDAKGHVMFRFLADGKNDSSCTKVCRSVWPPVMSKAKPVAGDHIKGAKLGLTDNGQVTYYGHPLYRYVGDPKPGKTKGDGIDEFGAKWFVVSPKGKSVKPQPTGPGDPGGPTGPALPTTPAVVGLNTTAKPGVLTNGSAGFTVYELDSEHANPGTFYCTGGCLNTWPPLLTLGAPTAIGGADGTKLGTVSRTFDTGTADQVTYNGYPLYTYQGDHAAGQTMGQYRPEGAGVYWRDMFSDGTPNPSTGH